MTKHHVTTDELHEILKTWMLHHDNGFSRIDTLIHAQPTLKKWFKLKAYALSKKESLNCKNIDNMLRFFGYEPIFPRYYCALLKDHRPAITLAAACDLNIAVISKILTQKKKDLRIQSALQIARTLDIQLIVKSS
jgi:hypothetical protein